MTVKKKKTAFLNFRVNEVEREYIRRMCEMRGVTISDFIRSILREKMYNDSYWIDLYLRQGSP